MTPCSHVLSESNLNVDHPHLTKPLSCLLVLYVWPQSKHINLGIKIQNVLYSFSTNLCIFVYFMYLLPRWYQKSTLLILVYIEGLDINVIYCCRYHKAILSSFAIYVTVIKLWNSGDFFCLYLSFFRPWSNLFVFYIIPMSKIWALCISITSDMDL